MHCDDAAIIALANQGVRSLQPYQPGKPIEELHRELGLSDIVKLASNENPLGISQQALVACQDAARHCAQYPDSDGFILKQALAQKLAVAPEQIALGNGSNELLDIIARVFLHSDQSAVFSQHAFIVYAMSVQACSARAIVTPAKNWGHDLDLMLQAIESDTRLVFIANPNNPTGTMVDRLSLIDFLDQLPDHVITVLDEAYFEYVTDPHYPDGVTLLKDYPRLIVTRTFSKAWGLAGLRVGYSVASPIITNLINRVRGPFNVSSCSLAAATAVLDDDDYLVKTQQTNTAGMRQLSDGFTELGLSYIPSYGNFIAVKMPIDAQQAYQQLLQQGVIVRPIALYDMPDYLRVSIGLAQENQRLLEGLGKILSP